MFLLFVIVSNFYRNSMSKYCVCSKSNFSPYECHYIFFNQPSSFKPYYLYIFWELTFHVIVFNIKFENIQKHSQYFSLFYCWKNKNTVQARKNECEMYRKDVLTEWQLENWFGNFRSDSFDIKDALHSKKTGRQNKNWRRQ